MPNAEVALPNPFSGSVMNKICLNQTRKSYCKTHVRFVFAEFIQAQ